MRIGMLWFDNSKDTFEIKCNRAIKYYTEKYNHAPTAIWCNPKMIIQEIPGITIVQSKSILVNHFWIGLEE